jgi:osmotically-inducible protein OsmY
MRLLTVLAMSVLAAGVCHYRSYRRYRGAARAGVSPADARLEESVRSRIAGAASTPVRVRCVNGVVTLRGSVRPAERDLVLAAALAVPGVTQVTSLLEIEGSAGRLGDEPVGDLGPMQSGIATGV